MYYVTRFIKGQTSGIWSYEVKNSNYECRVAVKWSSTRKN